MPFLEDNEVPEHPGKAHLAIAMTGDKIVDDVEIEWPLIAYLFLEFMQSPT
jgi:hypothetical protein